LLGNLSRKELKMKRVMRFFHNYESGQIIVIVALSMFALIAMAALILDGGALMANRRAAQNAADAGALAGARALCLGESDQIASTVTYYTETANDAELVEWELDTSNVGATQGLALGEVVVTARVENGSFFARIFGENMLTAEATAAAGCFPYQPGVVLPIAYPCRQPLDGSFSEDCDYVPLDWSVIETVTGNVSYNPFAGVDPSDTQALNISNTLFENNNQKIFIVVDSGLVCGKEEGDLNCDIIEDDGIDRYQLNSGDRGWLNLEAKSPSVTNLRNWIDNGVEDVKEHTWLSFIAGQKNAGYSALASRLDEVVWIPVFYGECFDYPQPGKACYDAPHERFPVPEGGECTVNVFQNQYPVAHIVSFAPFFPTCVQMNGDATFYNKHSMGEEYEDCPGFVQAQEANPDPKHPGESLLGDNIASMEGYFINALTLPEGDDVHGGADLGYYRAVLTR
jgi:Flp pilus assembly protein TadG